MKGNLIINIGREYGSLGHKVAQRLAERLDVPYYDKELIKRAAKESGVAEEVFKVVEEQQSKSFLFSIAMGVYNYASKVSPAGTVSLSDRLFLIQNDIIKKVASEGSCVIVGRCSNYILRNSGNTCVNIFIHANLEDRVANVMQYDKLEKKPALDLITKIDKNRANYYNYYTGEKWGSKDAFELIVNISKLGFNETTELLYNYIQRVKKLSQ